MTEPRPYLTLVDPDERLPLRLHGSTLFYRRLSLGALAGIERAQTVILPASGDDPPRAVLPRAALEAAIIDHVLVGWRDVRGLEGHDLPFSPRLARRLPGGVREVLLRRARAY